MGMMGRALDVVRGVGMLIAFVSTLLILLLASPIVFVTSTVVSGARLGATLQSYLSKVILFFAGVRVRVVRPPKSLIHHRTVFMYNHSSNFDPVIMQCVCDDARFIYKQELSKIPLFGWCLFLYQHIAVNRKNLQDAKASLDVAVDRLKIGQNCAISPEGTRSRTGELLPFKKGPFHVAVKSEAEIIPVVIRGALGLLPPKHKLPKGGEVTVTFLDPIPVTKVTDVDALSEKVRSLYVAELDKAAGNVPISLAARTWPAACLIGGLMGLVWYS
jgi:1-acyl-sn-glycerol-3-phosphate acyltransferase